MSCLVWLASYPKSGNTWFRIFLANLLSDFDDPVSINHLHISRMASDRFLFDEVAGIHASELTPEEIAELRPEVYKRIAEVRRETLFVKVHDSWFQSPSGKAVFPKEASRGAVYLVRNPLDLCPSFAHHMGVSLDRAIESMRRDHGIGCGSGRGIGLQLAQPFSSWSGHVESWLDQDELPVHCLRYEDMLLDSARTFRSAVEFLGLEASEGEIEEAIRFSGFEELRKQEIESGFKERSDKNTSFFRRGTAGSWRDTLSESQADQLLADHGRVMARLGYLDEDGRPVF